MNIDKWILGGGLIAIGVTVFAESGLLIGFFLPGDTLLFGAGILASQGVFDLWSLIFVVIVAAILGDNVGYSIGNRSGKRLFNKKESVFFRPEHLEKAEIFYEKHGGKTIIIARFIPMVRTFAPVVAGIGEMSRRRFMVFNVVGAVLWSSSTILLGYWLGNKMPWLEDYITPVILLIVVFSMGIALYHLLKEKEARELIFAKTKSWFNTKILKRK